MPFGALERPALSLGLLKAHCDRLGVPCDTRYLTFALRRPRRHRQLPVVVLGRSSRTPRSPAIGCSRRRCTAGGRTPTPPTRDEVLRRQWQLSDSDLARLERMREPRRTLSSTTASDPSRGRTTRLSASPRSFSRTSPRSRWPRGSSGRTRTVTIAFGGANWEEAMGVALQRQFPFVDLAFSGEADESFPAVLDARRTGEGRPGNSRCHRERAQRGSPSWPGAARARPRQRARSPTSIRSSSSCAPARAAGVTPTLLIETARGCWWGERSHCTFCGLNGATMAFRSKTPERVLAEIDVPPRASSRTDGQRRRRHPRHALLQDGSALARRGCARAGVLLGDQGEPEPPAGAGAARRRCDARPARDREPQ